MVLPAPRLIPESYPWVEIGVHNDSAELQTLKALHLEHCNLGDLAPLAGLTRLTTLDLGAAFR